MDVFEAIAKRHSYRGAFTAAPVPREDLVKIVQAGIQAPSGKNEQVASFVIVEDPKRIGQIAALLDKPACATAKAIVLCLTDPRPVFEGMSFAAEDCSASVENMLLAVTALGYATVWIDGALRFNNLAQRIGDLVGVPHKLEVRILLPIGVASQPGTQREKLPFAQRAWFNRYGG
jgi:nitroreductase